MPRPAKGPRLYLDTTRDQWVIRDGSRFVRTGCARDEARAAEKVFTRYLAGKYQPQPSPSPLIADVLLAYSNEHVPHTRSSKNIEYTIDSLARWWGDKSLLDVTSRNCRAYAATKAEPAARRDLETLRAAINYWHREYGPLLTIPAVVLPPKSVSRERWLTRSEAARLLWAARRTQHLKRFILLALYTGSRSGVVLHLQWRQLDLDRGVMRRSLAATSKTKLAPPVRLGSKILGHLRRWRTMDASPYVCHFNGQVVTKLRRSWSAAMERAGLTDVTPHTLRHTRATWLLQAGVDPWEAAGSLGMSVDMIQRVYGKHHPDFQKHAAEV
jgi:integrase